MSLDVGSRIGPYEIVAMIGTGGMGEVYHANDSRLDRSVAIKVLTSARGVQRPELDRFEREARAIARVNHPFICTVHDVGEHEGIPFLVMELLDGETLGERLELGALPVDRAVAIAAQIAEALDAAHNKGVIHRDLKPSNVMLTSNGVKLLDFGLAKLRDGDYRDGAREPTKSVPLTTPLTYRRQLDGSPAVRLGVGDPQSISPDGRWVLARLKDSFVLLPTGSGSVVDLPKGNLVRVTAGAWLSDAKRLVFTGDAGDNKPSGHIQEIPRGIPQPITSKGVVLAAKATLRDDTSVLGRSGNRWALYPIDGGPSRAVPAIATSDIPVRWGNRGQVLYVVDNRNGPGQPGRPAIDVVRVDIESGRRTHWKTLAPSDPVGVEVDPASTVIAADGRAYCYSFLRRLGDLYVADGLK